MFQRVQTIFLLLALAFPFGLLQLPFAETTQEVANTYYLDKVFNIFDNIALPILFGLGIAATILALASFRNRKLQIQLSGLAFVLNLIGLVLVVVYFTQQQGLVQELTSETTVNMSLGIGLPLLAMVFLLLARRFIKKDDKLVRSMDRLR